VAAHFLVISSGSIKSPGGVSAFLSPILGSCYKADHERADMTEYNHKDSRNLCTVLTCVTVVCARGRKYWIVFHHCIILTILNAIYVIIV